MTWDYGSVQGVPDWMYRGYTGHEHLPEFGLINMNARLYDPVLGRMLSADNEVGDGTQGFNRYSYANNNPLNTIDPSGNSPFSFLMDLFESGGPGDAIGGTLFLETSNMISQTLVVTASRIVTSTAVTALDAFQAGITVASMFPVAQTVGGLANAAIDVYRGNYGTAAFDVATAIPILGYLAKAAQLAKVAEAGVLTSKALGVGKVAAGVKSLGFAKLISKTNLAWSSSSLNSASKALLNGAEEVTVKTKGEAEELFLNLYHGNGYKNTTGFTTKDMKDKFLFPKGKKGTYHWDEFDTQHGGVPHLQIHDSNGNVIRIFYNN